MKCWASRSVDVYKYTHLDDKGNIGDSYVGTVICYGCDDDYDDDDAEAVLVQCQIYMFEIGQLNA